MNIHKTCYVWILGFMSGFNLLLTGSTLNFWLASNKIDKSTIGLFSAVSLPYAVNFFWAPYLDKCIETYKGQTVSVLIIYLLLALSILAISNINPSTNLYLFSLSALVISFFSTTGDIALGGIRSELLENKEHGPAGGIYNFGYRIGMTTSGSFAIYLSSFLSWKNIYTLSGIIVICLVSVLCYFIQYYKTAITRDNQILGNKNKSLVMLFNHLGGNSTLIIILTFLVLYRLSDNFIGQMLNVFLLELNYNALEIATTGKLWGTIGVILGSIIGGILMTKIKISKSLIYFGLIHAFAHIFLIIHNMVGKNYLLFFCTTTIESITCGMSMSAYMGLITNICKGPYKATQYALLTSMMGVSRAILPAISGVLVNSFGWSIFFIITIIITIPGLLLVPYFSKKID